MFSKLYRLPSNGKKVKEWSIDVYEVGSSAFIKRIHGYTDCKMQSEVSIFDNEWAYTDPKF